MILRFLAVNVDWGRFELRAANIPNLFSLTPIAHYMQTVNTVFMGSRPLKTSLKSLRLQKLLD